MIDNSNSSQIKEEAAETPETAISIQEDKFTLSDYIHPIEKDIHEDYVKEFIVKLKEDLMVKSDIDDVESFSKMANDYNKDLFDKIDKRAGFRLINKEGELNSNKVGRLHIVNKTIKEFTCRECNELILVGSKCFRQNIYDNNFFPKQTRVCEKCGFILNDEGVEIVSDSKKEQEIII